jgi:chemotaxis protein MotB
VSRRKRSSGGEQLRGDEWIATYSDTITLILTFFILLYSFSTIDAVKLRQISSALQSVLTGNPNTSIMDFDMKYGEVPVVGDITDIESIIDIGKDTTNMYQKIMEFIDENNLHSSVEIKEDSRGVIIELSDNILFQSARADLKPESKEILAKISDLIMTFDNTIIVEGHTDNIPMRSPMFDSNWELSAARAVSVLRYLVEVKGNDPKRFTAQGYGEYHPIVPNDSVQNRSLNRRVNILIVASEKETIKNE